MPAVSQIISIAKVSEYLAAQDIAKASLFGGPIDKELATKIYMERKAVEWKYTYDPTNTTDLVLTANYLLALCGKYAAPALIIVNGGTGGTVIGGGTSSSSSGGGSFYGDLFS